MFCRNCGNGIADNAAVCVSCGVWAKSGSQFCPYCATPTQAQQVVCVKCGMGLQSIPPPGAGGDRIVASYPPKDPVLMAACSGCCIAGLGQIILGQTIKGVVILLASMVLCALTMGISVLITWPLGAIDAYLIAKKLKEGQTVGQWDFF